MQKSMAKLFWECTRLADLMGIHKDKSAAVADENMHSWNQDKT